MDRIVPTLVPSFPSTGYCVSWRAVMVSPFWLLNIPFLAVASGTNDLSGFLQHILYSLRIQSKVLTPERSRTVGTPLRGGHLEGSKSRPCSVTNYVPSSATTKQCVVTALLCGGKAVVHMYMA